MSEDKSASRSIDINVLIVEDSATQAMCLQSTLEQSGFSVSIANNGALALEMLKASKPAVIISDIMMPEMDGYELCKHIKSDDNLNHIPVIFLTVLSSAKSMLKGLECGVDGFILKPYDDGRLISRIEHVLSLQRPNKPTKAQAGVDILYEGQQYSINLCRQQIVDNLISAYEFTVQKNNELARAHDELRALNSLLEEKVNERTQDLETEIHEHERVEEALRESERRFRDILENIGLATVMVDAEGNIVLCNDFLLNLTGWSKEEIIGKSWLDVFVPDTDKERVKQSILQTVSTGKPTRYEYEILTRCGEKRCISFNRSIIRDRDNKIIGIASIGDDVTDTRQIEHIKENEKRLRDITSALGEGLFMLNEKGQLTFMNPEAERLLGWTEAELRGKGMHEVIHYQRADGTQLPSVDCPVHKVIKTGEIYRIDDDTYTRKDGEKFSVAYVTTPIVEDGKIIASITAFQDITERKKAEEAKQNLKRLQKTFDGTVYALASIAEKRDPYTAGHQQCVAGLACGIGKQLGLPEEKIEGIRVAGILHDIGKISVPAEILSKPSKLSEAEFSIIKEHSQHGYDILRTIEFPWPISKIVLQHHERINGSGYPFGLTGEDILLEAKILAVADTIDAMASHRPYRPALGIEKALEEISANKGILYDPEVADACLKYIAENDSKSA